MTSAAQDDEPRTWVVGALDSPPLSRRPRWAMTHAHLRVVVLAGIGLLAALLFRRPDLVVLTTPLAIIAAWGVLTRPTGTPQAKLLQSHSMVAEGESAYVGIEVSSVPGQDLAAGSLATSTYVEARGSRNARVLATPAAGTAVRGSIALRPTRWGRRRLGPAVVGCASSWGAFRWGPEPLAALPITVVPAPEAFEVATPAPAPRGLVGRHRSTRVGEGTEFAGIRPFQWGDRLKRIHWARSLRSSELHVTTTHADQDTHVAIVLDAHYDLGRSEGVDGRPSSLDQSVRATAAVAEHFLAHGDRVSLRVLSHRAPMTVPAGSGGRHGVRIKDTLSRVVAGPPMDRSTSMLRLGLRPGALVVVVSAMVSPDATTSTAALASAGFSVLVIDTLDDEVQPSDDEALGLLAWRLRMIERSDEITAIARKGVPVVPWVGPGSLDVALRQLGRSRR
ncbi:hypothetical protein BH23ACT6_BH23ACT6_23110 [soil metagenome]